MRISGIHRDGLLGGSEGAARAVADHGGLSGGLGGVLTYAEPLRGIEAEKGFVACGIGGAGGEGEDGEKEERFHDDATGMSNCRMFTHRHSVASTQWPLCRGAFPFVERCRADWI